MITRSSEHIQVEGHYGTWHVIDDGWYALTPDVRGHPCLLPGRLRAEHGRRA